MKYSFVIPCYNSEKSIKIVVEEIKMMMFDLKCESYEIILIDDCSKDSTNSVIKQLSNKDNRIISMSLSKNFGQHAALMVGYKKSFGEIVISLDDDGQTPAFEIPKLLNKLDEGSDVVFAKYESKQHNLSRNLGSRLNGLMAKVLIGKPKGLYLSSFFVAKRYVINEIIKYDGSYPYVSGLLLRTTNYITNQTVDHKGRLEGASNYNLRKLFSLWLNGFTAFSIKPLRISMFIGVVCALFGFMLTLYSLFNWIFNDNVVMGWTSTIAAITGIGGIILIVLGMIGEYIGRIYILLNRNPQFVVRDDEK